MKINRHLIKNIILTISWSVLTFITDVMIINFYCIDHNIIKTKQISDFYELEMCVQSQDIITNSIFIFAGLLGTIGLYQMITSISAKKTINDIKDSKDQIFAAESLIAISVILFIIIKVSVTS